jgi:hypothetical protein
MEVSGQLHAPADLPLKEEPQVPNGWEAWWAPELVWMLWSTEKSLAPTGIEPRSCSQQPIVILTEIYQLPNVQLYANKSKICKTYVRKNGMSSGNTKLISISGIYEVY